MEGYLEAKSDLNTGPAHSSALGSIMDPSPDLFTTPQQALGLGNIQNSSILTAVSEIKVFWRWSKSKERKNSVPARRFGLSKQGDIFIFL